MKAKKEREEATFSCRRDGVCVRGGDFAVLWGRICRVLVGSLGLTDGTPGIPYAPGFTAVSAVWPGLLHNAIYLKVVSDCAILL